MVVKIRVPHCVTIWFFFAKKIRCYFSRFLRAPIIFLSENFRIGQDEYETLKSEVFFTYFHFGGMPTPIFEVLEPQILKISAKSPISIDKSMVSTVFRVTEIYFYLLSVFQTDCVSMDLHLHYFKWHGEANRICIFRIFHFSWYSEELLF